MILNIFIYLFILKQNIGSFYDFKYNKIIDNGDFMKCSCDFESCSSGELFEVLFQNVEINKDGFKICCECNSKIKKDEFYEFYKGSSSDNKVYVYYTCLACREVRDCYFCTFVFEDVWEDLEDKVFDSENDHEFDFGVLENLSLFARKKFFEMINI